MTSLQAHLANLRRFLLYANLFVVPLLFWLPGHEVFELPKTVALLIYSSFLIPAALPLFARVSWKQEIKRPFIYLSLSFALVSLASFFNGWRLLPKDPFISLERLLPLLACILTALVFYFETPVNAGRALWVYTVSMGVMAFYGLIQLLDQTLGRAWGLPLDLVRWTSFGESRIYSTMGNPDYMSAHLSILLPFFAGLGTRPALLWKSALKVSTVALALIPLALLLSTGNQAAIHAYGPWLVFCILLFGLLQVIPEKWVWFGFLYLLILLIVVAQGRGAYLGLAFSALVLGAGLVYYGGASFFKSHRNFWLTNFIFTGLFSATLIGLGIVASLKPDASILHWRPAQPLAKISVSLLDRIKNLKDPHNDSTVVRLFYYRSALLLGLQHPLLGVGLGNHALFTAKAQSTLWKKWKEQSNPNVFLVEPHVELYTHNDFIQNFAETGILGLATFVGLWLWFLMDAWKLLKKSGLNDQGPGLKAIGLMAAGAAFLASALFNFPWRVLASLQFCWMMFAYLAVLQRAHLSSAQQITTSFSSQATWPSAGTNQRVTPLWLGLVLAVAIFAATWPLRWFLASAIIRQGNQYKDGMQAGPAVANYEKAVSLGLNGTERIELYLYLGSMYNQINKPDRAIEYFEKGVGLYPSFIEAHYNLGYTYLTLFQSSHNLADRQKAKEEFLKVLQINPRYINALNNLGNIYFAEHDLDSAVAVYQQLLQYKADSFEPYYNLGASYLLQNKRAEAEKAFQKALELNPSYAPAKEWLRKLKALPPGVKLQFQ